MDVVSMLQLTFAACLQCFYTAVSDLESVFWLWQVVPGIDKKKASADSASLVEVGPRICLNPIKIFGGSFGGPVLFDNPNFVSPNRVSSSPPLCQSVSA